MIPWYQSCVVQLKRNRDRLKPFLLELDILPDPSRKDNMGVCMSHLQELAARWGLSQKDPDFNRKYAAERALAQYLAEYAPVVEMERSQGQVRHTCAVFR